MGYTTADWQLRAKDAKGTQIALKGQYLTVWKKQKDDSSCGMAALPPAR